MDCLFDIGRVLLDFDFESSLKRLLPDDCTEPRKRLEPLLERKDEFEAGRVSVEQYTDWALEVMGSDASHEEFHDAWRDIFTPNVPMWQTVHHLLDEGHRLILFSNINGIHVPWIYDEFPDFERFHGAVMSFHTGFVKPHTEIYQHAIREYRLIPSETLYIDDMTENGEAGRAHGFRTWQYDLHDHAAFEVWLDEQLNHQNCPL